jgi:hypothetical protein
MFLSLTRRKVQKNVVGTRRRWPRSILFSCVLIASCSFYSEASDRDHVPSISDVQVTLLDATSVAFRWKTDKASDSLAFWSENPDDYIAYGNQSPQGDPQGTTNHEITVHGLRPSTVYWFGIRSRGLSDGVPDNRKAAFWEDEQKLNKFTTFPAPKSGPVRFQTFITGPHRVLQGYDLYIDTFSALLSGTSNVQDQSYQVRVDNLPPNTSVSWAAVEMNGQGTVSTRKVLDDTITLWSPEVSPIHLTTGVHGRTPPGQYKLTITVSLKSKNGEQITKKTDWLLNVEEAVPLPKSTPASFPPIPNQSLWESQMTTYGHKWCQQGGTPNEQNVYYYDGIHVYQSIREYTSDTKWNACVENLLKDYRDGYVLANHGGIPLIRQFSSGLFHDWKKTGSAQSRTALLELAKHAGVGIYGFSPTYMREQAYALNTFRYVGKIQGGSPLIAAQVTNLIQMADAVSNGTARYYQPFMCGLLAEALIKYYEDGHQSDIRIPLAIKGMADALYANAYNKIRSQPGSFFYNSFRYSIGLTDESGNEWRGLNLLIAPMYAWLYQYTGDRKYQMQGDEIWKTGVNADPSATVGWSGKNFSQNYRWSFDYIRWRSAPGAHKVVSD